MSKKKRFIGHRSLGNILLFGFPSPIYHSEADVPEKLSLRETL